MDGNGNHGDDGDDDTASAGRRVQSYKDDGDSADRTDMLRTAPEYDTEDIFEDKNTAPDCAGTAAGPPRDSRGTAAGQPRDSRGTADASPTHRGPSGGIAAGRPRIAADPAGQPRDSRGTADASPPHRRGIAEAKNQPELLLKHKNRSHDDG